MGRDPRQRLRDQYRRIAEQLDGLFAENRDPIARMATAAALLQHKLAHFFWTGFYRLDGGVLLVGPYQGPLACARLEGPEGVCWACVERDQPVLVPDVEAFAGHVACDSRSRSELVLPVHRPDGALAAVLDVDSRRPDAFGPVDVAGLGRIADSIYTGS